MLRAFSLPTVCLMLNATLASAQVNLELKYPEGTSVVQAETKTNQTLTLVGMDLETKSSTFMTLQKTIGKRAADGTLKVEEKITSLQTELGLPQGLSAQFDSSNPDKKADLPQLEPMMEVLRAAFRLPVTTEMDSKNKITNVTLPEGEYDKLTDAAKERFKPETIKKAAEQAHQFLPDGPVKKGDTWERSSESNLGSGQVLSFRTKYEYAGTIEKDGKTLDKITSQALEVSLTISDNPQLQITNSDLKVLETAGTYLVDRQLGGVISRTSKVRIAGPLTLVINSMELPGKVDLTMEENVTRQK